MNESIVFTAQYCLNCVYGILNPRKLITCVKMELHQTYFQLFGLALVIEKNMFRK